MIFPYNKAMYKLFLLIFSTLLFVGCAPANLTKTGLDRIEFGSGGGFTGKYQTYVIDCKENTLLNSDGTPKRKLDKQEVKALTQMLKETDFSKVDFDHPSNLSYFLHFQGSFTTKITWGDPNHPAPEKAKELYKKLMEFVKK
jgi:hypothetical protein